MTWRAGKEEYLSVGPLRQLFLSSMDRVRFPRTRTSRYFIMLLYPFASIVHGDFYMLVILDSRKKYAPCSIMPGRLSTHDWTRNRPPGLADLSIDTDKTKCVYQTPIVSLVDPSAVPMKCISIHKGLIAARETSLISLVQLIATWKHAPASQIRIKSSELADICVLAENPAYRRAQVWRR